MRRVQLSQTARCPSFVTLAPVYSCETILGTQRLFGIFAKAATARTVKTRRRSDSVKAGVVEACRHVRPTVRESAGRVAAGLTNV